MSNINLTLEPSMSFATIETLESVQRDGYAKHYSTLAEYHAAQVAEEFNRASEHIEAGREPYLLDEFALEFGTHPLVTIYDVMIEEQDGLIGVSTAGRDKFLPPNTLLAWRA